MAPTDPQIKFFQFLGEKKNVFFIYSVSFRYFEVWCFVNVEAAIGGILILQYLRQDICVGVSF